MFIIITSVQTVLGFSHPHLSGVHKRAKMMMFGLFHIERRYECAIIKCEYEMR